MSHQTELKKNTQQTDNSKKKALKEKIQLKHFFQPKLKTMVSKELEADFGFVLGYN